MLFEIAAECTDETTIKDLLMRYRVLSIKRWILFTAAAVVIHAGWPTPAQAGLFKLDFGHLENERIPTDADGNATGDAPAPLKDWTVIPTWTFAEFPDNKAIWKLTDFSNSGDNDVTMTVMDNIALAESLNAESPPYSLGMTANNPTKEGLAAVYDGVVVPAIVKDDYLYRNPDTPGTEMLFRFANLNPGKYNVTVFMGRTSDGNGRYGKVWVDDINGKKEPAQSNTGDYGSRNLARGEPMPYGQAKTVTVELKAGEYLWFAEMEDNSGGISGMIIRSVTESTPPPPPSSGGLFKMDFGHLENERVPVDADGNPVGDAPAPLKDWTVIPTWTFGDFADGNAVWKLTDFANSGDNDVTLTAMDNAALTAQLGLEPPQGMTANNPTKENVDVVYDGVLVPAIVKDDYLYRNPDTAGTEMLFRFANLNPGKYNVTAFMGRTSDGNGRFGKVWVDDINGKKEPATSNTGDYGSRDLASGAGIPYGQPRTVTVDIKAGEYLWFAEMEDNSGGISGLIIRGIAGSSTSPGRLAASKTADGVSISFTGTLQVADAVTGPWADVAGASSPYSTRATGGAKFFRAR